MVKLDFKVNYNNITRRIYIPPVPIEILEWDKFMKVILKRFELEDAPSFNLNYLDSSNEVITLSTSEELQRLAYEKPDSGVYLAIKDLKFNLVKKSGAQENKNHVIEEEGIIDREALLITIKNVLREDPSFSWRIKDLVKDLRREVGGNEEGKSHHPHHGEHGKTSRSRGRRRDYDWDSRGKSSEEEEIEDYSRERQGHHPHPSYGRREYQPHSTHHHPIPSLVPQEVLISVFSSMINQFSQLQPQNHHNRGPHQGGYYQAHHYPQGGSSHADTASTTGETGASDSTNSTAEFEG